MQPYGKDTLANYTYMRLIIKIGLHFLEYPSVDQEKSLQFKQPTGRPGLKKDCTTGCEQVKVKSPIFNILSN